MEIKKNLISKIYDVINTLLYNVQGLLSFFIVFNTAHKKMALLVIIINKTSYYGYTAF